MKKISVKFDAWDPQAKGVKSDNKEKRGEEGWESSGVEWSGRSVAWRGAVRRFTEESNGNADVHLLILG